VFSVYDEIVFEVPEQEAEEANAEIPRIMTGGDYIKDWTEGLALEVEGDVCERYHK
jgi:DNA polymerase I-like protein with 3'-5' exonuclease and polymerase domains